MNAIGLLLGLLVLSYLGSILVSGRTIRGFGLPSGAEYLLLGFVFGPSALGVINGSLLEAFAPVLVVGTAWVTLCAGLGYGQVGSRPVRVSRAVVGIVFAALVAAGVSGSVFLGLSVARVGALDARSWTALAAGAVCSETTRHAVRWVAERHGARGDLSDALADYARASALVPAALMAVLFAAAPGHGLPESPLIERVGLTLAIGVLLGMVSALLLGREFRRDESWGILLGVSLLGIGIAARLGLSCVSTTFFLGLTVTLVSPHRSELKFMVAPTERPVLLPVLVLAGASVHGHADPALLILVGCGLIGRLLMDLTRGAILSRAIPSARPAGSWLGLGMLPIGAFSLSSALAYQLRVPGAAGSQILAFAAVSALLGELLGPLTLRRALTRAKNIDSTRPPPEPARMSSGNAPRASGNTTYKEPS